MGCYVTFLLKIILMIFILSFLFCCSLDSEQSSDAKMAINMYKESVLVYDLYEKALLSLDEDLFNEAHGVALALLEQHSKISDITKHPGVDCHNALLRTTNTMNGLWYEVVLESKKASDYTVQQIEVLKKEMVICHESVKKLEEYTEELIKAPLPSVSPIDARF